LGGVIVTAIVSYNATEKFLNDAYEVDTRFDHPRAETLHICHKIIAGSVALNLSARTANILGRIMYKSK
jgi:hypothetical protein